MTAGANATAAFGRWSDMLVYEWQPLEIAVNPFAQFPQAIIGTRGWIAFNAAPPARFYRDVGAT